METVTHRNVEEQARLAAIIDSSSDAIIAKNLKGIITDWNPSAELLYGYTAKEAINQSISIIIPHGKQHELDDVLQKVRNGERVSSYPTDTHGKLRLSMIKNPNEIVLVVQDNGRGLPPNFDFQNTKTLGMQLMQNLTKQLSGTIKLDGTEGTTFTLTFPYKNQ